MLIALSLSLIALLADAQPAIAWRPGTVTSVVKKSEWQRKKALIFRIQHEQGWIDIVQVPPSTFHGYPKEPAFAVGDKVELQPPKEGTWMGYRVQVRQPSGKTVKYYVDAEGDAGKP